MKKIMKNVFKRKKPKAVIKVENPKSKEDSERLSKDFEKRVEGSKEYQKYVREIKSKTRKLFDILLVKLTDPTIQKITIVKNRRGQIQHIQLTPYPKAKRFMRQQDKKRKEEKQKHENRHGN